MTVTNKLNNKQTRLCKIAAMLKCVQHGLPPSLVTCLFDNNKNIDKNAQYSAGPQQVPQHLRDFRQYLKEMKNVGIHQAGGRHGKLFGFAIQDPLSQARIKAVIDGIAAVPATMGARALHRTGQIAQRFKPIV